MTIVHHHERTELVGDVADASDVGNVAVHGEHTIGDDKNRFGAVVLCGLHLGSKIGEITGGKSVALGFTQPNAVNDGSMVERIRNYGVFWAEKRLEHASVGIKARSKENGVVGS